MTRDEFIDGYMKNAGRDFSRTAQGVEIAGHRRVALPCACGEEVCNGWAMVLDDPDSIAVHNRLYGPAKTE